MCAARSVGSPRPRPPDDYHAGMLREWSVYPVWIVSEPRLEYAKVRAVDGAIGVGARVEVQRAGRGEWQPATVVEKPDGMDAHGHAVWLRLE